MKKTVVLGITGSIAAYTACDIISGLKKRSVDVHVILTRAGAEFITPLALETMSANPVITDMFNRNTPWEVEHIALAKRADVFLVAPASANFMAKAAAGIADDMLTTTLLATRAPLMIAPAMNTNMYLNTIVQRNMDALKASGAVFIEPESGLLACGDTGVGRLADPKTIVERVMETLYQKRDLEGKRVLVSAGPTQERIDPVRYITNRSSGKMGYAIAEAAQERGACVTLVSGPVSIAPPDGVNVVNITSSADMFEAVTEQFESCDILIMAAAPADFTPPYCDQKIKKHGDGLTLELSPTKDILASLGANKGKRIVVGFAAETQNIKENAARKLEKKNLDAIAANDVSGCSTGFGVDENRVTLFKRNGESTDSGVMTKTALAHWLLDRIAEF